MFTLRAGEPFQCQFSDARFAELQALLLDPWEEPQDWTQCRKSQQCVEDPIGGAAG